MTKQPHYRPRFAFGMSIPIGLGGGLIGLGGAEFRLAVLAGPLGYMARQAVALNLAISLIILLSALAIRSGTLSLDPIELLLPVMLAIIAGAVTSAFFGAGWARHISNERLERIILVLLVIIGSALMLEAFLPQDVSGFVPEAEAWRVATGVLFGLATGLVSSMLGVAGGEIIIPTLVFAYGADIKVAGTASLIISIPTVFVGVARHARHGSFSEKDDLTQTVLPMGVGSIIGAVIGGLLVGLIPSAIIKFGLGIILNVSALRIFHHRKKAAERESDLHRGKSLV